MSEPKWRWQEVLSLILLIIGCITYWCLCPDPLSIGDLDKPEPPNNTAPHE